MDPQATLAIAAELAIGVAGFSTIASAIATRSQAQRTEKTWFRFRVLLQASMGIAMLAYMPMVLGAFLTTESALWASASAVYFAWVAGLTVVTFRDLRELPEDLRVERSMKIIKGLTFIDLSFHLSNIALIQSSWPYLAGLGCGITIALIQFFVLLRGFWWQDE